MPQLPIQELTLDGFRGLRSLKIEGLGLLNIFVGGNNSGKTSVLEAISILADPTSPEEWLAMVRRRDFGGLDETRVQSLRWCFIRDGNIAADQGFEASCSFSVRGRYPLQSLTATYRELMGQPSPEDVRRSLNKRDGLADIEEPVRGCEIQHLLSWRNDSTARPASRPDESRPLRVWETFQYAPAGRLGLNKGEQLKCSTLTPYSYQINRLQVKNRSWLTLHGADGFALDLLRNFDNDVESVELASFAGERPAIYIKHRKFGMAPLTVFGDAMRRCVLIASTLPSLANGGLLLIDEAEVGIHVSLLPRVFRWLLDAARKLGVQVMITTHSLEALDAALTADESHGDEEIAAFHLEMTSTHSMCRRFSGDMLRRLRFERGLDVR